VRRARPRGHVTCATVPSADTRRVRLRPHAPLAQTRSDFGETGPCRSHEKPRSSSTNRVLARPIQFSKNPPGCAESPTREPPAHCLIGRQQANLPRLREPLEVVKPFCPNVPAVAEPERGLRDRQGIGGRRQRQKNLLRNCWSKSSAVSRPLPDFREANQRGTPEPKDDITRPVSGCQALFETSNPRLNQEPRLEDPVTAAVALCRLPRVLAAPGSSHWLPHIWPANEHD
jgi:hypothetical protein